MSACRQPSPSAAQPQRPRRGQSLNRRWFHPEIRKSSWWKTRRAALFRRRGALGGRPPESVRRGECEVSPVLGRHGRARLGFVLALITIMTVTAATACTSMRHNKTHTGTALQREYEATVAKVLPSVVEITAGHSTGSGVVLDRRGDIVTNAHVVGTVKKFEIRVSTASEPMKARLVGVFSPDDLAVIKVMKGAGALKPVHWANSPGADVGAIVLAMGSPYGLTDSVTQGIVSATGRTVTGPTIPGQAPTVIVDAVQTSAAINPGNSGGALVLLSGHVLGIPTLSAQDPELGGPAQGIGFAIPSNTVLKIGR